MCIADPHQRSLTLQLQYSALTLMNHLNGAVILSDSLDRLQMVYEQNVREFPPS